jgi:chitosanase
MTLTTTQARTAQAIVNLFETGSVLGEYGQVTLIEGDTGHLTFGRSQTTLGSGNLHGLIERYCANAGARFGPRLATYLPRLAATDLSLDADLKLQNLLRASADDRVMRETQDRFFDEVYWQPAVRAAERLGFKSPLGTAVVYDSHVHGSWGRIRDRTTAIAGAPSSANERKWITTYVATRRQWLATNSRTDLRATVYRMDAFGRLIELGFWGLELPLVVRGAEISSATLNATPPGCYDGPEPGSRALALQTPLHRGLDVRLLQLALSDRGVDIRADGVFGQGSLRQVKAWQQANGLPATGIADIALIASLTA